MLECAHVLVEPAGAAALAGAWEHRNLCQGRQIVILLSGANVTAEHVQQALAGPALFDSGSWSK